jgi:hypothetical protein
LDVVIATVWNAIERSPTLDVGGASKETGIVDTVVIAVVGNVGGRERSYYGEQMAAR